MKTMKVRVPKVCTRVKGCWGYPFRTELDEDQNADRVDDNEMLVKRVKNECPIKNSAIRLEISNQTMNSSFLYQLRMRQLRSIATISTNEGRKSG